MLYRFLLATFVVSASFVGTLTAFSTAAQAFSCGTGYLERLDRRGNDICVAASKVRAQTLAREQMMRRKQIEWRANLARDRQLAAARQSERDQARRLRALN